MHVAGLTIQGRGHTEASGTQLQLSRPICIFFVRASLEEGHRWQRAVSRAVPAVRKKEDAVCLGRTGDGSRSAKTVARMNRRHLSQQLEYEDVEAFCIARHTHTHKKELVLA